MDSASTIVQIVATASMGLVAGIVLAYANSVMPGLRTASDRTFVEACQRVNTAIHNPLFMVLSNAALVFVAAAAVLHVIEGSTREVGFTIGAVACYVVTLALTFAVNIPLNNALIGAGDPDSIDDLVAVRTRFERPWNRMNVARTAACTAAFCLLLLAAT